MAFSRIPVPEGLRKDNEPIDDGTLARLVSPTAGPVALLIKPKVLTASPQVTASQFGIAVNSASQISAGDWMQKINASGDVPDYFKNQIKVRGDTIFVTDTKKFQVPKNVIPKDWLSDWLTAFMFAEWELTTGCLDMSVKKGDSKGPFIMVVQKPDLSSGENIDPFTQNTMTNNSRSTASVMVDMGITLPDGVHLNSGRKLIVVANRIALTLGDKIKKVFNFDDSELVSTWFHEIACHAGRHSARKVDTHGDKDVDSCASDIEAMFPNANTLSKVDAEIQVFLKSRSP
jgi:hypothetical protein